ncbi:hypothetical protein SAMN02745163_00997 [Clostridium cavendishii DSM 21758]|uniref:Uncharacterized protein n=1 Tax=Clostridium cavendishii DSM 21758 TaxID=1121302 RepID=A0A1M6F009_9CLOT|nr:hypothetical protein [Clostridium cavendishii]SHI90969.1 hypothetical protein SAMN02745163_00997 [Clostridium cavendishii DSM 21758]
MNAKRNIVLNLICAALFFINAFLQVQKNNNLAISLWSIGGVFWLIVGYANYRVYKNNKD